MLYRPNVAAILQNGGGEILICERADHPGSWQFPQGGVDAGETFEGALPRELREEISLEPTHYTVDERRGPYRYLFPAGTTKKGFHGQEQVYFRLRLVGSQDAINVATAHPEFRAARWVLPGDFPFASLPPMKQAVYRQVFRDFFGVIFP